jgi:SAM-dependent methyltransferase
MSLRTALRGLLPSGPELAARLIERQAAEGVGELYGLLSEEQARNHYGEEPLHAAHIVAGLRLFHAWKVAKIRRRLGPALDAAAALDVGDSDGLLLRDLGKRGVGVNLSEAAIANIRGNGIEAVAGDVRSLPFPDAAFDFVICSQTLEHVPSQHAALLELARVCRPGGHCFVSVPWVPETTVHPRLPGFPLGEQHIFELDRDDFAALLSHTPFRIVGEDVCWVFGRPQGVVERLYLWRNRGRHLLADTFRGFQLFELERA